MVILDTDHLWGLGGDSDWVWKSFMRRHHPIYMDAMQFMVKGGVLEDAPGSPGARKAMGDTLQWSQKINLAAMKPMGSLCSTNYCLANPGSEYLIYRHGVGPVDVQLGDGSYTATWFDVERGSTVISPDPVEGGGLRTIVSPFAGPAVLHLSARAGTSPAPPPAPVPVALAVGWMSGWTDRKSIVIPSAQVTGDHTDFPVLIQFSNDPHLSSRTRADGSDLVFTAGDGMTRLAHSIQNFDPGGGNLTAWVKVPRLSDTSDTRLYLYFGNSGSGYEQTPQDIWSGGYTGVWHLNDAQSDVHDATSFQHHALRSSTAVEPAGKISAARRFVRSLASFVEIPATPTLTRPSITAEAWIHASPGSLPLDVISIGDNVTVRVEPETGGLHSTYSMAVTGGPPPGTASAAHFTTLQAYTTQRLSD